MLDSARPSDLAGYLDDAAACVAEAWPQGHPTFRSLEVLRDRLAEARLQVAILGQFKRGKSTVVNALLRDPLLPTAVVPATAIPTFITWDAAPRIRVTFQDNQPAEETRPEDAEAIREQLSRWVTEEGNPVNHRGVKRVDLFVPAEVLRGGIVLIDTPGIGSTLRHNTEAALQVLPECDAALFVVSADPPITEAETAYLRNIQPQVARLFFVLNKMDYLGTQEQGAAIGYLRNALCRMGGSLAEADIFPISARQALAAIASGDNAAFEASGLPRLEREILVRLSGEKANALRASVRIKAKSLLDHALADLALKVRALELPLEDLEQRARTLQQTLHETQTQRQSAQDMLEGDRRRALEELERQAESLRREAQLRLDSLVQRLVDANHGRVDRSAIQHGLDAELPAFFEEKLGGVAAEFRHSVETILAGHQARADALARSVRETTASLFDIALPPEEPAEPFRLGPEPYWVTLKLDHAMFPSPGSMVGRLLTGRARQQHLRRKVRAEIADLVQRNVENLRWATLRGLDDTFRRFAAQLDERLAEALSATDGSIRQVIERRRCAADEAAGELERLAAIDNRLRGLRSELESSAV